MKTLLQINSQSIPSIFFFHFPSLSREIPKFNNLSFRKWHHAYRRLNFSSSISSSLSNSPDYGGWDDLRHGSGSDQSGESTQLHNFLVTLGINDKKYAYMFLLGLISGLAISRVRVSSVMVFPASVTIFAVGFLFGLFRSGNNSNISFILRKKGSKDEYLGISVEKLRNLLEFFNVFDVKVANLRDSVKKAIASNHVTTEDLEFYVEGMELIRSSAMPARDVVEACINSGNKSDRMLLLNPRRSKKEKELGEIGIDIVQYLGSLFGQKLVALKPTRGKDNFKTDTVVNQMHRQSREDVSAPVTEKSAVNTVNRGKTNANVGFFDDISNKPFLDQDVVQGFGYKGRTTKGILDGRDMDSVTIGQSAKRFNTSEEHSHQNNRSRYTNKYTNNGQNSLHMGHQNEIEMWTTHEGGLDCMDFRVRLKHTELEALFEQQHAFKRSVKSLESSGFEEESEKITDRSDSRRFIVGSEGDFPAANDNSPDASEVVSSSVISEDVKFDRYLTEASSRLKQAREYLRRKDNGANAENVLYKAAEILSDAVAMKPMSLLAVGLLGNTYLLHGELKLKISRELRAQLQRGDSALKKQTNFPNLLEDHIANKNKIASLLIDVCEECEDLLVEAGRKYRLALSIDGNDARALYNWGLALSFRAQLIADIGPEAAFDADKVFLAAIDKFDAMMSKDNVYAPDALFRWGVALQQRSRLRPTRSKEKVKLLQQAKRLYEDALDMDSDNLQVKEALSSCKSELNSKHY